MKYELISIDKQCSDAVNTLKELTMQLTNVIESKFDVALITAVLTDNFGVLNKSCCPTNKYNCLNCEFMLNSTSKGANSTQIFVECAGLNPADLFSSSSSWH